MVDQEVLNEKPMMMAEVKEELERIRKRDTELNFRAAKTEEYLNQFVQLDGKTAKEIYDKLIKLEVPRLRDLHISKIIDLMPANINELKTIIQGYTITVSNENLKKIIDVLDAYRK